MDYERFHKNTELYKNVIEFVKSGYSLLEDSLNNIIRIRDEKSIIDNQDPVRKMTGFKEEEIAEDRMFVYQYIRLLVDSNKEALENTDEFKDCLSTINNDHIFAERLRHKQFVVLGVIYRLTPVLFFMHILTRCLYSYVISKSMDRSLLGELYNDFERFLFEPTITIMTLSALKGFTSYDSELNLIQLSDNLSIRRLSLDEKISIYQRDVPSQMLPPRANWVIEYKSTIEKNLDSNPRIEEGFDSKMIDNIFASVITAMRLVQEGSIGINSFIRYIPLDVPIYVYYIGLINPQLIFKEFSKLDVVKRGRAIHNLNLDPKRVPRNINNPKSSIDEEKAREAMFGNILRTLDEDQQKAFEQNPHVNKDFSKFIKENIQKIRLYSPNNPQWSMYEMDEDNFERLNRAYASLYPDIYEDLEHIREGLPNRIEGIRKSRLHSTRQPRNKTSKAEPRLSA